MINDIYHFLRKHPLLEGIVSSVICSGMMFITLCIVLKARGLL